MARFIGDISSLSVGECFTVTTIHKEAATFSTFKVDGVRDGEVTASEVTNAFADIPSFQSIGWSERDPVRLVRIGR